MRSRSIHSHARVIFAAAALGLTALLLGSPTRTPAAGLEPEVEAFLADRPARYAALPDEIPILLVRSMLDGSYSTAYRGGSIWDYFDNWMGAANLQTLVQIHREATRAGLWPSIHRLRDVYSGTSWGIEFYGPKDDLEAFTAGADSGTCHDIDAIVRRDHGHTLHRWWRLLAATHVGFLHLGIDDGQGYHNLHLDSTNPANSRGSLGSDELCSYGVTRTFMHNLEIRLLDGIASGAVRGFMAVGRADSTHRRAFESLDHDLAASPAGTQARWLPLRERLAALIPERDRIEQEAHTIATLQDGPEKIRPLVEGDLARFLAPLTDILKELTAGILEEGTRNGYFHEELLGPPYELLRRLAHPLTGPAHPQAEDDLKALSRIRSKLESDGALKLDADEVGRLIVAFEHVREISIRAD